MAQRDKCEFCECITEVEECEGGIPKRTAQLCEVCGRTAAANAHFFPEHHWEDGHILRSISVAANMVLDEIRSATRQTV